MDKPTSKPAIHEKFARKVTIVILLIGRTPLVIVTGIAMDHWIIRATIDFTAFSNVVENLSRGETGHAFIINKAGILQTGRPWSGDETVLGETAFEDFDTLKALFQDGQNELHHPFCPDGKTLVVTSYIRNGDWLLVYQQKKDDIFSALMRTHKIAFGTLFIGGVGIEVLRRIKEKHPKTEVILLTGQASTADGVEGIKSGAFDYLSKPVDIDHLAGKVKQAHEKIRLEEVHQKETAFREKMKKRMATAERLAALGTLSAGVAHEINNPLAIINQSVKWIQLRLRQHNESEVLVSRAGMDKALEKIDGSVERARQITHQLLGSVRRDETSVSEIDPEQLIDEALLLVKGMAGDRGVEIQKKIDSRLTNIWSDSSGLRQVMTNLLINIRLAEGQALLRESRKGGRKPF